MGLETAVYINDLNISWPIGASDVKGQGDDHIRNIKIALKNSFPNITGAMTRTQAELNNAESFAAGNVTKMLFYQASCPVGWTDAGLSDRALRVVASGSGGTTGGSVGFSSIFGAGKVTGSHVLTIGETPVKSHSHGVTDPSHSHSMNNINNSVGTGGGGTSCSNAYADPGSSGSYASCIGAMNGSPTGISINATQDTAATGHDHTLSLDLTYANVLVCQKT